MKKREEQYLKLAEEAIFELGKIKDLIEISEGDEKSINEWEKSSGEIEMGDSGLSECVGNILKRSIGICNEARFVLWKYRYSKMLRKWVKEYNDLLKELSLPEEYIKYLPDLIIPVSAKPVGESKPEGEL
uniref:Uncharacterized protein n=2 Tax=viral metagenome TaxID=1070528 RepID=A0A6M3KNQ9_9ZZZZ